MLGHQDCASLFIGERVDWDAFGRLGARGGGRRQIFPFHRGLYFSQERTEMGVRRRIVFERSNDVIGISGAVVGQVGFRSSYSAVNVRLLRCAVRRYSRHHRWPEN
jgi:hypothetical protein